MNTKNYKKNPSLVLYSLCTLIWSFLLGLFSEISLPSRGQQHELMIPDKPQIHPSLFGKNDSATLLTLVNSMSPRIFRTNYVICIDPSFSLSSLYHLQPSTNIFSRAFCLTGNLISELWYVFLFWWTIVVFLEHNTLYYSNRCF